MQLTLPSLVAVLGAALASITLGCTNHPEPKLADEVDKLVEKSKESNRALLRGDIDRYGELLKLSNDFTLMSPFGGKPSHGVPTNAKMREIGTFFKNGTLEQEVVQSYGTRDMVVLAIIERAKVEVGGLPAQDWALRVTLVYRREGSDWQLVHRHADPLANAITVPESARLARGAHDG